MQQTGLLPESAFSRKDTNREDGVCIESREKLDNVGL